MNDDRPQNDPKSKPWLPPELAHLRFLGRLPDTTEMELEELIEFHRERIAAFQKHAPELERHNVPYKEILTMLHFGLAQAEARKRVRTATGDELLHAMADLADVRTEIARSTLPLAERYYAEAPFDPITQEMKEAADELRKEVPKDL